MPEIQLQYSRYLVVTLSAWNWHISAGFPCSMCACVDMYISTQYQCRSYPTSVAYCHAWGSHRMCGWCLWECRLFICVCVSLL